MLIFGGLYGFRRHLMALYLTNNGQSVNIALTAFGDVRAKLNDLLPLLFFHVRVFVHVSASCGFCLG